MVVQVKICGIDSTEAADAALRAGTDFVGLVFYEKSPRNLAVDKARALASRLQGRTQVVALFADASDERIAGVNAIVRPDFFQLHGQESPDRVAAIRARFGVKVIKALAVSDASDLAVLKNFDDSVDLYLLDAKALPQADRQGGHGVAFDWKIVRGHRFNRPWLLAGGLDSTNVARAIAISGAAAVDVSSGVESALGIKSPTLIADFVAAARGASYVAGATA